MGGLGRGAGNCHMELLIGFLHEVLAPLDREEFVRQVEYYNDLYGEEEEQ